MRLPRSSPSPRSGYRPLDRLAAARMATSRARNRVDTVICPSMTLLRCSWSYSHSTRQRTACPSQGCNTIERGADKVFGKEPRSRKRQRHCETSRGLALTALAASCGLSSVNGWLLPGRGLACPRDFGSTGRRGKARASVRSPYAGRPSSAGRGSSQLSHSGSVMAIQRTLPDSPVQLRPLRASGREVR